LFRLFGELSGELPDLPAVMVIVGLFDEPSDEKFIVAIRKKNRNN